MACLPYAEGKSLVFHTKPIKALQARLIAVSAAEDQTFIIPSSISLFPLWMDNKYVVQDRQFWTRRFIFLLWDIETHECRWVMIVFSWWIARTYALDCISKHPSNNVIGTRLTGIRITDPSDTNSLLGSDWIYHTHSIQNLGGGVQHRDCYFNFTSGTPNRFVFRVVMHFHTSIQTKKWF